MRRPGRRGVHIVLAATMPSFCRHNRLLQNCPICTKEQDIDMRPVVTRFADAPPRPRPDHDRRARARPPGGRSPRRRTGGMTVRRLARDQDDGFQSGLVPGLRSAAEARRLADEVAFASTRVPGWRTLPRSVRGGRGRRRRHRAAQLAGVRDRLAVAARRRGPVRGDRRSAGAVGARWRRRRPTPSAPDRTPRHLGPPRRPGPPRPTAPGRRAPARRPPRTEASRAGRPNAASTASTSGWR